MRLIKVEKILSILMIMSLIFGAMPTRAFASDGRPESLDSSVILTSNTNNNDQPYLNVNLDSGIISSLNAHLFFETMPNCQVTQKLRFPANSKWAIMDGTVEKTKEAFLNNLGSGKSGNAPLLATDWLGVISEDETHFKAYTFEAENDTMYNAYATSTAYRIDFLTEIPTICTYSKKLTTALNVSEFMENIVLPTDATYSVFRDIGTINSIADYMGAMPLPSNAQLGFNDSLVVMSGNNQVFQQYKIDPLNASAEIETLNDHFSVDATNSIITSKQSEITEFTTFDNIIKFSKMPHDYRFAYFTHENATFENASQLAAAFKAGDSGITRDMYVKAGDMIWVMSEDEEHFKGYTISFNGGESEPVDPSVTLKSDKDDNDVARLNIDLEKGVISSGTIPVFFEVLPNSMYKEYLNVDFGESEDEESIFKVMPGDVEKTKEAFSENYESKRKRSNEILLATDWIGVMSRDGEHFKAYTFKAAEPDNNTFITTAVYEIKFDDWEGEIEGGSKKLSTAVTVEQFLSNIQIPEGASVKVVEEGTPMETVADFDSAQGKVKTDYLGLDDYLFVKSANGNTVFYYDIDADNSSPRVTTSADYYTISQEDGTIASNTREITGESTFGEILSNLELPESYLLQYFTHKGITFENSNALQLSTDENTSGLGWDSKVENGDIIWIMAEDNEHYKGYSLVVKSTEPSSDSDTAVTSSVYKVKSIGDEMIIESGSTELVTSTTVGDFVKNLKMPENSTYKIVSESIPVNSVSDYDNLVSKTALDRLSMGEVLVVKSANGKAFKKYKLFTVPAPEPEPAPAIKFTAGYPKVEISGKNVTVKIMTNTDGKIIHVLKPSSELPMSVADLLGIKTPVNMTAVKANEEISLKFNELEYGRYRLNLLGVNSTGEAMKRPLSLGITHMPTVTMSNQTVTPNSYSLDMHIIPNAVIRYIVKPLSEVQPTASDYFTAASAKTDENGKATISISGLTSNTAYRLYAIFYIGAVEQVDGSKIFSFTTTSSSTPTPPTPPPTPKPNNDRDESRTSSTPAPAPVSAPTQTSSKIEVIVNGIKEALAESTERVVNGVNQTILTVDEKAILEKVQRESQKMLAAATSGKSQRLNVELILPTTSSNVKKAEVKVDTMKSLIQNEVVLDVKTDIGSYALPTAELKSLVNIANNTNGTVEIKVEKASEAAASKVSSAVKSSMTQVSVPVDFSVIVKSEQEQTEVSQFSQYVLRTLPVPNRDLTTGLVLGADGNLYHVPTVVIGNNTPSAAAKINSLTNSVYTVIFNEKSFEDVKGHKYEKAISSMASRTVIEGTSEAAFSPEKEITRAEFATMLTKALGLYRGEMGKGTYKDMTNVQGLNIGITVATDYGLIKGVGSSTLLPNESITGEQLAAMLHNASTLYAKVDASKLTQTKAITSNWSKEAVAFATAAGMIENFSKDKKMTRAEAAFAIYELLVKSGLINE